MKAKFLHSNIYTVNLKKSLEFYEKALGLKEVNRMEMPGFTLVYLGDGITQQQLEITWVHQGPEKYDLGDNTFHIAFGVEDFEAAKKLHTEMNCICYENPEMGIYFIADPDGNWLEILPMDFFK